MDGMALVSGSMDELEVILRALDTLCLAMGLTISFKNTKQYST